MQRIVVLLVVLVPLISAYDCGYPNGTDVAIHTFNCDSNQKMIVTDSIVLDENGNEMYPVNFKQPIVIQLTATNVGDVYEDNKVNVYLSEYSAGWIGTTCSWREIPTFGLLNNLDGCDFAHNCPLATGDLVLNLPLDLSAFSGIISVLIGTNAHQLEIKMYNYNPGVQVHDEIACVVSQMKIV